MKTYQQKGNINFLILNQKTKAKVFIKNVIFVKGCINYSIFYMNEGKEKIVSHSIKFFENHLETQGFLRIHRGCMINPEHIINYDNDNERLVMSNGQITNVSRRKKHVLKKIYSTNEDA